MIHLPSPRLCPCGVVHRDAPPLAHDLRPYDGFFLTAAAKNAGLDAIAALLAYGSLHSAYSNSGANEIAGGSPAYARKALTWASASGGSVALSGTPYSWDVPASTVAWLGFWSAASSGTFRGMLPAGGKAIQRCSVETSGDISSDLIFAPSHGYTAGNTVVFWGTLPTGLTVGTIYYVIAAGLAANAFSVSTTLGGSAVDLTGTAPFVFLVQQTVVETFSAQGVFALSAGSFDPSLVI